jgi:hypothetical protein
VIPCCELAAAKLRAKRTNVQRFRKQLRAAYYVSTNRRTLLEEAHCCKF